jgi:hypothetical protein
MSPADRVVLVQGAAQGTGVIVGSRLILTAAHVVLGFPDHEREAGTVPYGPRTEQTGREEPRLVTAIHPTASQWTHCEARWIDAKRDLALLRTEAPLLAARPMQRLGRLRWGTVATQRPLPGCQVIGFPDVQRDAVTRAIECDQYVASMLPMAGVLRDKVVLQLAGGTLAEHDDASSPLAGLSGAPVFAGGVLIGIVTTVPQGRAHSRIEAEPVRGIPLDGAYMPQAEAPLGLEKVTDLHPRDELFEEEYRRAVATRYRKIEIIGIDELGTHEARWELDTAYLHLEAERERDRRSSERGASRRIDSLLASSGRRVLLRGEAGAGKTTLMWWLAAHTASGTLGPELTDLNGLVPFVVPLRSLRAQGVGFPTPRRLADAARLVADEAPEGWARRVLDAGRGLLLIDGLDEVPQEDRSDARQWLGDLLSAFKDLRCLVTVRPLAVEEDWLDFVDFGELRLLPMRDSDIQAFVKAWHNTARLARSVSADDRDRLFDLERELQDRFASVPTLRNLARTPLLCAVICALHRRRGGLLPTSRTALYKAALEMLLGGRDSQRKIKSPEGVEITGEEQQVLLQRIAVWLVRNGQAQLSYRQAESRLEQVLPGMPQVSEQGGPEVILRHLLNRSGVLEERTEGSIQFIHRTFHDYLAAKELQQSDHLPELLRHASQEEWEDVVVMAIGHCKAAEAKTLVDGLLTQGDAAESPERWHLHLLAAHCAAGAVYLDEVTRRAVADRVGALMPPRTALQAAETARLGPYALPMLPGPSGLGTDEQLLVMTTLSKIGTLDCLPLMLEYAQQPDPRIRQFAASAWGDFPMEAYARDVLSRIRRDDLRIPVNRAHLLRHLHRLGKLAEVVLSGAFPSAQLDFGEADCHVDRLRVRDNPVLGDLSWVRQLPATRHLVLEPSVRVADISALDGSALRTLDMDASLLLAEDLEVVPLIPDLRELRLRGLPPGLRADLPPRHPAVARLLVDSPDLQVDTLHRWTGLRALTVVAPISMPELLHQLRALPRLRTVQLPLPRPAVDLVGAAPVPNIEALTIPRLQGGSELAALPLCFPGLKRLTLHVDATAADTVNLTTLNALPDLTLTVRLPEGTPALRGSDRFHGRLHMHAVTTADTG